MDENNPCLVEKYEALLELRNAKSAPKTQVQAQMRLLSSMYPGALRELDRVSSAELTARLNACRSAVRSRAEEAVENYHQLWREALAYKSTRGERHRLEAKGPRSQALRARIDDGGNLNPWIFAHAGISAAMSAAELRHLMSGQACFEDFPARSTSLAGEAQSAGLCFDCEHCRTLQSAKGSVFRRCGRHDREPGFRKYPPLPVLLCAGFEGLAVE